jgi:TRAP-type mannitol/chloroaromatic compound transport system permease small subunit
MSLVSGLAINVGVCLVAGGLLTYVRRTWMLVLLSVSIPFVSAYLIYWGAVYATGGDASGEHSHWAGLFIGTWAIPAYLAIAFGLMVGKGIRRSGASANK